MAPWRMSHKPHKPLEQFLNRDDFAPQGTFGDILGHFELPQVEGLLVGRGQ